MHWYFFEENKKWSAVLHVRLLIGFTGVHASSTTMKVTYPLPIISYSPTRLLTWSLACDVCGRSTKAVNRLFKLGGCLVAWVGCSFKRVGCSFKPVKCVNELVGRSFKRVRWVVIIRHFEWRLCGKVNANEPCRQARSLPFEDEFRYRGLLSRL